MRERLHAVTAREDGISLIEMLVAIMILGIALAAFASSMVSSLQAVGRDHRLVVANALATEVIEELQGLPWEEAGFYEDEAISQLGGTTFEGEELVLVSGARGDDTDPVPEPVRSVTRDGIAYTVTTAITWVDDEQDGLGDADTTGDTQDYKRFVVELEWSLRGRAHDLRVTALRTADTRERPLRAEAPDTVPLDGVACNETPVDLSATTLDPAEYVEVSYATRDDNDPDTEDTASIRMGHAGDRQTWSLRLTTSCEGGPFPDGPVLFTFTAEDRATGDIYEVTEIVTFQRDVAVSEIRVSEVEVLPDGTSKCAVTVEIDVDGGTMKDTVIVTWDPVGPDPVELDAEQAGTVTAAGATFTHTYPAGTSFGDGDGTDTSVIVDVVRGYDSREAQGSVPVTIQRVQDETGSC